MTEMEHEKEASALLGEGGGILKRWAAGSSWVLRRHIRNFLFGLAIWVILISLYVLGRSPETSPAQDPSPTILKNPITLTTLKSPLFSYPPSNIPIAASSVTPFSSSASPAPEQTSDVDSVSKSPFSGTFERIPRISALEPRQRRMTLVGVWNDDSFPAYMHHHLYSVQLNADVVDLLLINRRLTNESKCLDLNLEKLKVNMTVASNIKVVCLSNEEWKRRHVDFMCGFEYGWNCNATEYEEVLAEYSRKERFDEHNYNWRPFRGYVFRDLFENPKNPFWAWIDHDVFLGNFLRYPFNVLSQLSILTGYAGIPTRICMWGQLTAFNFDDKALGTAWKKFPQMQTAAHFTKYIEGEMPESSEERYWSFGYMRQTDNLPGTELSYGVYPDIHGDDLYKGSWNEVRTSQIYVISGREILLVETSYSREEIEELVRMERDEPVDDLGSIGWSTDDSAIVEDVAIYHCRNVTSPPRWIWTTCVDAHPLTLSETPALRETLIHFKDQEPMHIWRRSEKDTRPRGYERKLLRHHLKSKNMDWFEFPPFEIKEDMVLRYNSEMVEVYQMGKDREKTLFYRKEGDRSIG